MECQNEGMVYRTRPLAALILAFAVAGGYPGPGRAQAPIDVYDLADYRLTPEVFKQFVEASHAIGEITRRDSAFTYAPLFTKEVALSGDAPAVAAGRRSRPAAAQPWRLSRLQGPPDQ